MTKRTRLPEGDDKMTADQEKIQELAASVTFYRTAYEEKRSLAKDLAEKYQDLEYKVLSLRAQVAELKGEVASLTEALDFKARRLRERIDQYSNEQWRAEQYKSLLERITGDIAFRTNLIEAGENWHRGEK